MKKGVLLLVIMCGIFSLTGCGKKEPIKVELAKDNFEDYFSVSAQVSDFTTEEKETIIGTDYIGHANLKITVNPKKEITTENVVIKGQVTYLGLCWAGNYDSFEVTINKDGEGETIKSITTTCPTWRPENPEISRYFDNFEPKAGAFLMSDKKILILSISGSIYEIED